MSSQQKWVRATILVLGTLIFFAFLGLDPLVRTWTKRDHASGVPQQSVGTVVEIHQADVDLNAKLTPPQVLVRFRCRPDQPPVLILTDQVFGSAALKVDGPAQILYRVGRSGRVYVDRVEPLSIHDTAPIPKPATAIPGN